MIFTPDYTIELPEGQKIPLLFNSLFFREFCIKKGIELEDLFELISQGKAFKGVDLPLLLFQGAYTWHRYTEGAKSFPHNYPEDPSWWLDMMGGYGSPKLIEVFKMFVCKLSNIDPAAFDVMMKNVEEPAEEEKKSETASA